MSLAFDSAWGVLKKESLGGWIDRELASLHGRRNESRWKGRLRGESVSMPKPGHLDRRLASKGRSKQWLKLELEMRLREMQDNGDLERGNLNDIDEFNRIVGELIRRGKEIPADILSYMKANPHGVGFLAGDTQYLQGQGRSPIPEVEDHRDKRRQAIKDAFELESEENRFNEVEGERLRDRIERLSGGDVESGAFREGIQDTPTDFLKIPKQNLIERKLGLEQSRGVGDEMTDNAIMAALASMGLPYVPEVPVKGTNWRDFGAVRQALANVGTRKPKDHPDYEDDRFWDEDEELFDVKRRRLGWHNAARKRIRDEKATGYASGSFPQYMGVQDLHGQNLGTHEGKLKVIDPMFDNPLVNAVAGDSGLDKFRLRNLGMASREDASGQDVKRLQDAGSPHNWLYGTHGEQMREALEGFESPEVGSRDQEGWSEGDDHVRRQSRMQRGMRRLRSPSARYDFLLEQYLPLLMAGRRKDLSRFSEALPKREYYDPWFESIMDTIREGDGLNLDDGGKQNEEYKMAVEALQQATKDEGALDTLRRQTKLLGSIADDPEQMRLFEFANPTSAKFGEIMREAAQRPSADINTAFEQLGLGEPTKEQLDIYYNKLKNIDTDNDMTRGKPPTEPEKMHAVKQALKFFGESTLPSLKIREDAAKEWDEVHGFGSMIHGEAGDGSKMKEREGGFRGISASHPAWTSTESGAHIRDIIKPLLPKSRVIDDVEGERANAVIEQLRGMEGDDVWQKILEEGVNRGRSEAVSDRLDEYKINAMNAAWSEMLGRYQAGAGMGVEDYNISMPPQLTPAPQQSIIGEDEVWRRMGEMEV